LKCLGDECRVRHEAIACTGREQLFPLAVNGPLRPERLSGVPRKTLLLLK